MPFPTFNDSFQVKHHCAEERCHHPIYHNFLLCRKHSELIRSGHNPTECPYYSHTEDNKPQKWRKKKHDRKRN